MSAARDQHRAAMVRFGTLDPAHWRGAVASLAAIGFDTIDVPVVWRDHEVTPTRRVFDRDRANVLAALAIVRDAGLRAIVRLGPYVTLDAPGLGIPERILRDGAMQARTRRGMPVYVPDPPRVAPMPSIASATYRRESADWIASACEALFSDADLAAIVDRVVVGHGPEPFFRDDPAVANADEDLSLQFASELLQAAERAGTPTSKLVVAISGGAHASTSAHTLASRHRIVIAAPLPTFGALAIWRHVRYGLALGERHGTHVDVFCGGPALYPPVRGAHGVEAARLAIAAGARSFTVRMGAADERWVGAVVADNGDERAVSRLWRELLAWCTSLGDEPPNEELCVDLPEPKALQRAIARDGALDPLSTALAAFAGLPGADLVRGDHDLGAHGRADAHAARTNSMEERLANAALPFRRSPHDAHGPLVLTAETDPAALLRRARGALGAIVPDVKPRGSVLVRAARVTDGANVTLASCSSATSVVTLPASGSWHRVGQTDTIAATLEIAPGDAVGLTWRGTMKPAAVAKTIRTKKPDAKPRTRATSRAKKPRGEPPT